MVLSKAFHYIPHNLLVAKPHAYGLSEHAVTFVSSYLKRRKQGVEINDAESVFQILLEGIQRGSIWSPILSNIFINYLFLLIKDVELADFADEDTMQPGKVYNNSLKY